MLYYSSTLKVWSDQLPANIAAATRNKFASWGDNLQRYAANGWTPVTESSPVYDGSPLTGQRVRAIDAGGTTFSWMVGETRWQNAIDTLEAARQRCRNAIDAATSGAQQQTIEYTIPSGGKLNGVAAAGQIVELWMIHPDVSTYWVDFKSMFDARGAFQTEEFDCTTGRVEIPGSDMLAVFALVATQGSLRRTAWRRLEAAYAACETAADYDALTAAIT